MFVLSYIESNHDGGEFEVLAASASREALERKRQEYLAKRSAEVKSYRDKLKVINDRYNVLKNENREEVQRAYRNFFKENPNPPMYEYGGFEITEVPEC